VIYQDTAPSRHALLLFFELTRWFATDRVRTALDQDPAIFVFVLTYSRCQCIKTCAEHQPPRASYAASI